ncbi:MAG: hypothetical protein REI95_14120 [Oxalicibacterium faecigallinarum]|uniref:hypothetical protein n=1 Tax=Oxalicibacterium faecigallinarum TaxID=573741 RepID=UPI002806C2C7|nr:hypothetical protein [Oxalicibacterium faecigallinarum]MDQ7970765.1 hypothetical protein [Oxalicibacterium faecigallinarum]
MKKSLLLLSLACAGLAGCQSGSNDSTTFVSKEGDIRLQRPARVVPSEDFSGRALLQRGWRVIWDGSDAGDGQGVVRLTLPARAPDGSAISEVLQIGRSQHPDVVASCLTYGLVSGSGMRLPVTTVNRREWTTYSSSDAGMSQSIKATNYRLVVEDTCYTMDRISYAVRAAKATEDALSDGEAANLMDAVLASVEIQPMTTR